METIITTLSAVTADRSWGIDVPNYFWFTGSSSAAFIVANLYLVFGIKKYKPVAGFLLLVALAFLFAAPINLIDDLKQPARIYNFFAYAWSNFPTSPMKWGVVFLMSYFLVLVLQVLFFYKPFLIKQSQTEKSKFFLFTQKLLSFNAKSVDENKNNKLLKILGLIGIPASLLVDGYTGFLVGILHSNPLWSSPIMPVLFLASAMVSGLAFVIFLLPFFQRHFTQNKVFDKQMVAHLSIMLSWFIVVDLVLRGLWLSFALVFAGEEKLLLQAFFQKHFVSVVYVEYLLCLVIPMIIGFSKLRFNMLVMAINGIVVTSGVWWFRWSIVIEGQGIPKSVAGFLEYAPSLFGANSITSVASNWLLFGGLMLLFTAIFPWDKQMSDSYEGAQNAKQ